MKFFKHFSDAHEGRSMQALMNEWGLEGYAAYFILMELCAKKLEKRKDEALGDEHFRFTFNERIVREKLRMRSTKVELFLNSCSTLVLLQFTKVEQEFNFYVPKLLECLDRDTVRARPVRGPGAPKIKIKKEDQEAPRPREDSGLKKQEIRFRFAKEIEEIRSYLAALFDGVIPKTIDRRIPEILIACNGDVAAVHRALEDLYQSPKIRTGEGLSGSKSSYAVHAIVERFNLGSAS